MQAHNDQRTVIKFPIARSAVVDAAEPDDRSGRVDGVPQVRASPFWEVPDIVNRLLSELLREMTGRRGHRAGVSQLGDSGGRVSHVRK